MSSGGLGKHPDFLKLWAGQTNSLLGDQVSLLALPLTAVVFLRANAFQMGLLTAAGSAPALLFALIAGVWINRLQRRPVLLIADLGRSLLLCFIPLLFAFAFFVGTLAIFFTVAYRPTTTFRHS